MPNNYWDGSVPFVPNLYDQARQRKAPIPLPPVNPPVSTLGPKPFQVPGVPADIDSIEKDLPDNFREMPSGYDVRNNVIGSMSMGAGYNPAMALQGLQGSMAHNPEGQRMALASQFRMDPLAGRHGQAFGNAIQADAMKGIPQQFGGDAASAALGMQHPTVQAVGEQKAEQAAYGDIGAARIKAQQQMRSDAMTNQTKQQEIAATQQGNITNMLKFVMEGLANAQKNQVQYQGRSVDPTNQQNVAMWKALLQQVLSQSSF